MCDGWPAGPAPSFHSTPTATNLNLYPSLLFVWRRLTRPIAPCSKGLRLRQPRPLHVPISVILVSAGFCPQCQPPASLKPSATRSSITAAASFHRPTAIAVACLMSARMTRRSSASGRFVARILGRTAMAARYADNKHSARRAFSMTFVLSEAIGTRVERHVNRQIECRHVTTI